jgi:hypothetical protein
VRPISSATLISAAQYVRMSTEHQQYSTENESAAISEYAARHGIQSSYKGMLERADRDCVIRSWLEDNCKPYKAPATSDRDRDDWVRDLLLWMELVYVQTDGLEEGSARAWRADVQSYFQHPELCKRAKLRLQGNDRYWEDVFWNAIPSECRGGPSTAAGITAGSASMAAFSVRDVKAKLIAPRDESTERGAEPQHLVQPVRARP